MKTNIVLSISFLLLSIGFLLWIARGTKTMNQDILGKIIDKVFSGSFSMLVLVGITYCIIMISCVYLAARGKIPMNDFLILVAGLGTTFMALWKDYTGSSKTTTTNTNGGGGNVTKTDSSTNNIITDQPSALGK